MLNNIAYLYVYCTGIGIPLLRDIRVTLLVASYLIL
jgi:hypothetical protein